MAKTKSVPMRMCIACRQMKPKKEMTRVVKTVDGEISADPTGKAAGRGAYICKSRECLKKARKSRRLESALECSISDEIYARMEEEMSVGK